MLQEILRAGLVPLIVFSVSLCGGGSEDSENRPGIEQGEERSDGERGEADEEDD